MDIDPAALAHPGDLHRADREGRIVLHFQPKVDLGSEQVVGLEALVRWDDPERGLLGPGRWLGEIERAGLMSTLTDIVLRRALEQAAIWQELGRPWSVAVNLAVPSLLDVDLVDRVRGRLEATGVAPSRLVLELTEGALMEHPESAYAMLGRLRTLGVGVSLDDFGTGYSSLARLSELAIDELKIDRSFVQRVAADDGLVVRLIAELGQRLGYRVVAEGVEDEETMMAVAAMGCDQAQGYFIARPLAPGDVEAWATGWHGEVLDRSGAAGVIPSSEATNGSAPAPSAGGALHPAQFDGVLDTVADAFVAIDESGTITAWNAAAETLFGWSREEAVGRRMAETIVPEAMREAHERGMARLLATGEGRILDTPVQVSGLCRDGREVPILLTISAVRSGPRQLFCAFIRDRSTAVVQEGADRAHRALTSALIDSTPEDRWTGPVAAAGAALGWDFAAVWLVDPVADVLRCAALWDGLGAGAAREFTAARRELELARGGGPAGKVWQSGEPLWLSQASSGFVLGRTRVAERGPLVTGVWVPVRAAGEIVGVLELLSHDERPEDPQLLVLLERIAARLGGYAAHVEAEQLARMRAGELDLMKRSAAAAAHGKGSRDAAQVVCEAARAATDATVAALFVLTAGGHLTLRAIDGADPGPISISVADEASGSVVALTSAAPYYVADVQSNPAASQRLGRLFGVTSAYFHPVIGDDGAVGVLLVAWKHRPSRPPDPVNGLMPVLADHAAVITDAHRRRQPAVAGAG